VYVASLQLYAKGLQPYPERLRVHVGILEVYAEDLQPYANDLLMHGEGLSPYAERSYAYVVDLKSSAQSHDRQGINVLNASVRLFHVEKTPKAFANFSPGQRPGSRDEIRSGNSERVRDC